MSESLQYRRIYSAKGFCEDFLANYTLTSTKLHGAVSVAHEQLEYALHLIELAETVPLVSHPTSTVGPMQPIRDEKMLAAEGREIEAPMICGYPFVNHWAKTLFCKLEKGHEGSHFGS